MTRWQAAAIHVSISAAIGLASAALIYGLWYPPPYGSAAGATELVVLLLGVDVVLGPLMTLIVFKSGKKGLRFDLSVIALFQVCALLYGLSVVVRARPAFIVAEIDRFIVVTASDLESADLAKGSKPEFQSVPWFGPRLVAAALPTEVEERNALVFSGTGGKDIEKFPKYYVDYQTQTHTLLEHAKPLDDLRHKRADTSAVLDTWLRAHNRNAADIVWLPLKAPRGDLTMLLDRNSGESLDALPVYPW